MSSCGFRHEALIYEDRDEFLAGAVAFLREGLELGEPALVAVGPENTTLLEGALGEDAFRVRFAAMRALGRNPARIIPFWRDFVDEHEGRPVRGIGEPVWPGRNPAELDECQRHEALLNVAFSAPPEWSLLCPYDGRALDDRVLDAVACSHPVVAQDGSEARSADYHPFRDCFAGGLPACPVGTESFEFDRPRLHELRSRIGHTATAAGMPIGDAADLVAAASEVAANSICHGGGAGKLRIWRDPSRLVVEVEDGGRLEEPLAGRLRPGVAQERGRGLWIANQLCDLVQIRSGAGGTTVRLHAAVGGGNGRSVES